MKALSASSRVTSSAFMRLSLAQWPSESMKENARLSHNLFDFQ